MDYISEFVGCGSTEWKSNDSNGQDTLKFNRQNDVKREETRSLQKSGRKATNLSLPVEEASDAEEQLAASFVIDNNAVEFSSADIKISR